MLINTRCIVLRTVKYGDNSLIVDLLTREHGRLSVVWRVPKTGKGKIKRQYFQFLTILDIIYDHRESSSLPLVKEAHIAEAYSCIPFDSVKLAVAFFVAEFLAKSVNGEQKDHLLYDFIEKSLVWYDASSAATANFHLMFMMRVSRFLGFYPNIETYSPGAYFDLRAGLFSSDAPFHKDFLLPEEADKMLLLMRMNPYNMHLFRFSRSERNRAVEVMLKYYSLHIPGFRELKSWEVLCELFA